MKPSALAIALSFAIPTAAYAAPAADTARRVDATVQLRAADGKVSHDLRLTTVEHECTASRTQDGTRSFEVELCHRRDTADGRVLLIKWSMQDGKRVQRHEGWAVLAAGGTVEVGAAKGTGDTLIVSIK